MAQLSTLSADNAPQRALIYGEPKSGKSVAVGNLSSKFKIVFIDLENGLSALLNNLTDAQKENIEYIKLRDSQDNPVAITLLPEILRGGPVRFCEAHSKKLCPVCMKAGAPFEVVELGKRGTETIVAIDSFTQLTDSVLGKVAKDLDLDEKLQFDHWGEMMRRLGSLMSAIQVAPYHICATSHEQIVKMPSGKEKLIPTLGSRNSSKQVARYFDHLIRLEVRNKDFVQYSAQSTQINAQVGTRSNLDLTDPALTLLDCFLGTKRPQQKAAPSNAAVQDKNSVTGTPNKTLSGR